MDVDANGYGAAVVPTLDYDSLVLVPYCLNWPLPTSPNTFIYWVNTVSVQEQTTMESGLSGFLSRDCFVFNLPTAGRVKLSIYDVTGRLVFGKERFFEGGENRVSMARPLQPGIYIWRLRLEEMDTRGRSAIF